jgi:23S rRNA (cytidine1920-2'-O)/16S rRNA (cytidine1409-2'-O)-methyltransferase
LVRRGLVPNRQQAQAAVAQRRVLVSGAVAEKPSRLVSLSDPLELSGDSPRFVSRGGDKLDAALEQFVISVAGRTALDAGASTGGFTDCLLQRGSRLVYAIDVGYGQLDARLRADPRVRVHERTNVRYLRGGDLDEPGQPFSPVGIVTADLSFISLTVVLPVLRGLLEPGGDLVVLVKPQFEAGRQEVSRGRGVVRNPETWRRTVLEVASALESAGTGIMGVMVSPVIGPAGNTEFLVHAVAGAASAGSVDAVVEAALGALPAD